MEERNQSKPQQTPEKDKKIVDLTADMEMSDQSRHKIIDLGEDQESVEEEPGEEIEAGPEKGIPASNAGDKSALIEDEVDAAFDEVQAGSAETEAADQSDDPLFDKLTHITEMVDETVRDITRGEKSIEDRPSQGPSADTDYATLASAAAELDAAMSPEPEEEGIIELTDVADPADAGATESAPAADEAQDVIDLVDMVPQEEMENAGPSDDDEGLIELTDIVAPDEIDALSKGVEEETRAGRDDFAADEIDALFDDDDLLEEAHPDTGAPAMDEIAIGSIPPMDEMDAADEEQVIQLSNVVKKSPQEEKLPIEKVKLGAEEDIANHHIPLEEQEAAEALGLDLEKEAKAAGDKEIEAALEQILQTKYADILEQLIASAVEKAVTREIENIKRDLAEDD